MAINTEFCWKNDHRAPRHLAGGQGAQRDNLQSCMAIVRHLLVLSPTHFSCFHPFFRLFPNVISPFSVGILSNPLKFGSELSEGVRAHLCKHKAFFWQNTELRFCHNNYNTHHYIFFSILLRLTKHYCLLKSRQITAVNMIWSQQAGLAWIGCLMKYSIFGEFRLKITNSMTANYMSTVCSSHESASTEHTDPFLPKINLDPQNVWMHTDHREVQVCILDHDFCSDHITPWLIVAC